MNSEQNNLIEGVFLNGKAQVVEMLQHMTSAEREVLLRNIKKRNSPLADELMEKSLNFSHLNELSDEELSMIFPQIKAPILGIALKGTGAKFQRRLLSLAPRDYAENAYEIMMKPLSNEDRDIKRAQTKVVHSLAGLLKRKRMNL